MSSKSPEELVEELTKATNRAEELLRETRGMVKDLIDLNLYTRQLIERHIDDEVRAEFDEMHKRLIPEVQKVLDGAVKAASEKFQEFTDIIMGTDTQARRKGLPSVESLIHQYAASTSPVQQGLVIRSMNTKRRKKK